jgi:hypothetical protein
VVLHSITALVTAQDNNPAPSVMHALLALRCRLLLHGGNLLHSLSSPIAIHCTDPIDDLLQLLPHAPMDSPTPQLLDTA